MDAGIVPVLVLFGVVNPPALPDLGMVGRILLGRHRPPDLDQGIGRDLRHRRQAVVRFRGSDGRGWTWSKIRPWLDHSGKVHTGRILGRTKGDRRYGAQKEQEEGLGNHILDEIIIQSIMMMWAGGLKCIDLKVMSRQEQWKQK